MVQCDEMKRDIRIDGDLAFRRVVVHQSSVS